MKQSIYSLTIISIVIILFSAFTFQQKPKLLFEYALYEYNSSNLASPDDLEISIYYRIFDNGLIEVYNKDKKSEKVFVDKQLVTNLKNVSINGLKQYVPIEEVKPGHFYAWKYSYLSFGSERVCFNPYEPKIELRNVLKDLGKGIDESKKREIISKIKISNRLIKMIKETHNKSSLLPISNPPPAVEY